MTLMLLPPTKCDVCGYKLIRLIAARHAYGEGTRQPDRMIYHCPRCNASVGVESGTTNPLGYMASIDVRALRATAHSAFDGLWKFKGLTRTQAYVLLARELHIDSKVCHIGVMSKDELMRVIEFAEHYQSNEADIERRREAKKNVRATKRKDRESVRASRAREADNAAFKRERNSHKRR